MLHTLAGPEIGVASTKAFTTQLCTLACMALALAVRRAVVSSEDAARMTASLRTLPKKAAEVMGQDADIRSIASAIAQARDVLYMGRGAMYPVALEGALKLKEISYIHAEGYAAGEMKHGPIALIDDSVPVVVIAPSSDPLFEKTASNLQEAVARGARVLLISDAAGAERLKAFVCWSVTLAESDAFIAPILYTIPVQLLAYHAAILKGTDVDQPRNLAKSVTVE